MVIRKWNRKVKEECMKFGLSIEDVLVDQSGMLV